MWLVNTPTIFFSVWIIPVLQPKKGTIVQRVYFDIQQLFSLLLPGRSTFLFIAAPTYPQVFPRKEIIGKKSSEHAVNRLTVNAAFWSMLRMERSPTLKETLTIPLREVSFVCEGTSTTSAYLPPWSLEVSFKAYRGKRERTSRSPGIMAHGRGNPAFHQRLLPAHVVAPTS